MSTNKKFNKVDGVSKSKNTHGVSETFVPKLKQIYI